MTAITQDERVVLLRRDGPVAVITLNRPEALNAINSDVADALGAAVEEVDNDPELRVGIITGTGRAFCAGADLKALAAGKSILPTTHPEWGFAGLVQHYVTKPLIAAINGFALGGGTEIALACDLAVISSEAALGLPEVKRGLIAGAGGVLRLPDQIPPKVAAHVVFTGEPISPDTALHWGLVNTVTAPDKVLSEALRLARIISANAPLAVRTSKKVMSQRRAFGSDWDNAIWAMNSTEFDAVRASADAREGTLAFAEKRQPIWQGR